MRYKIAQVTGNVGDPKRVTLEEVVEKLIKEGYRPIGGVSVAMTRDCFIATQAMVKEELFQWDSEKSQSTQVG